MDYEKRLMIIGIDLLLSKINKYPDNHSFSVKDIIKLSNKTYDEIINGEMTLKN